MSRVWFSPRSRVLALVCSFLVLHSIGASAADRKSLPFAGYTKYVHYKVAYRVNSDGTHTEIHDWAMKVLGEQGLSSANRAYISFSDQLQRATILDAYTLKADGRRLPVPPSNFQEESNSGRGKASPMFSDLRTLTVAFPDVAVGDTVVMSYKLVQKEALFPGNFSFIESFSRFETFDDAEITLSAPTSLGLQIEQRGMTGGELPASNGRRNWSWSYRNAEVAVPESDAVSTLDYGPMVVASTFKDYGALANAYNARAQAKAVVTPRVRRLADELTAHRTTVRDKSQAIYEWVARNIQYVVNDVGVGSVVPHEADLILANRMGDCKDHATLLQALLAAKGIASTAVLINGGNAYTVPKTAAVNVFDHVINYLPALDLYVDSTSRYTPFGLLPFGDSDKPVVHVAGFSEIQHTPPTHALDNQSIVTTRLEIKPDESAVGQTSLAMHGLTAEDVRAGMIYLQPNMEELAVRRSLERNGLVGTGTLFKDDPNVLSPDYHYGANYELKDAINLPGPGAIAIAPPYAAGESIAEFAQEANEPDRTVNFECLGGITREQYTIKLPPNVEVLAIPRDVQLNGKHLNYRSSYRIDHNAITASRELIDQTPGNVCTPADAAEQKSLARAVRRDLRAQIVYRQVQSEHVATIARAAD